MTTKHNYCKNTKKCYFCNEEHSCRNCPLEQQIAPILKNKIGILMEHYIANNFKCPLCNKKKLHVIGNNSPSLDIVCSCGNKIEVKSKCLSVSKLPNDIQLPHGNYNDYINRLKHGLELFIIIYGVDRINKIIKIREILYANHSMMLNENIINVIKKEENTRSTIIIKDRTKLNMLPVPNIDKIIDFTSEVENYKMRLF
jgi:hypothetical protein